MTDGPDRVAVLPRGINVGARNKVSMPVLRQALTDAGFTGVRTHLASGNIVCERVGREPDVVAAQVRSLVVQHFGVDVVCLARTRAELDATVTADPLRAVADDPSRHFVVFGDQPTDPAAVAAVDVERFLPERLAVVGRDLHTWYPDGTHGSRLAGVVARLAPEGTARNWRTVLALQRLLTDP